ncbi:MAG: fluoride exporter, partial [Actinomycetota bacterium]|nr:fluoride exporter [Actinomycetota bacterium]
PGAFAWATLIVNVVGCLLIGVLMGVIARVGVGRLVRPFLGIGVLGGFTTFSTYVADIQQSLQVGAARTALAYLATTLLLALVSVWLGQNVVDRLWSAATARNTRSHSCPAVLR